MSRNNGSMKETVGGDLISVVVPVYNIEKYLDRCVKSIVEQTYSKLQIILVDDGSKDGSAALCDRWQEKDERIEVYHKENGGAFTARNLGITKAVGEWIIFIDGDDYLELEMLERMHQSAIETDSDAAICSFFSESPDTKEITTIVNIPGGYFAVVNGIAAAHSILDRSVPCNVDVVAWNKLFRREIIEKNQLRFPKHCPADDMWFTAMLFPELKRCVLLNDAYYHYILDREGANTSSANRYQLRFLQDEFEVREEIIEHYDQIGEADLADWGKDHLLYLLLCRYKDLSALFCPRDEQMKYLKEMIKKHKDGAKRRRTRLGYRIWRISPRLFVWLMKKHNFLF